MFQHIKEDLLLTHPLRAKGSPLPLAPLLLVSFEPLGDTVHLLPECFKRFYARVPPLSPRSIEGVGGVAKVFFGERMEGEIGRGMRSNLQ